MTVESMSEEPVEMDAFLKEIEAVYNKCKRKDWDFYFAAPVTFEAFEQAKKFAETILVSDLHPFVGADPNGDISFDWINANKTKTLSISVSKNGMLVYSFISAFTKAHATRCTGSEPMDGNNFNGVRCKGVVKHLIKLVKA